MKRKLDTKRLDKLISKIIKTISVFFLLLFFLGIYYYNFRVPEMYQERVERCDRMYPSDNMYNVTSGGVCILEASKLWDFWMNVTVYGFVIAFFPPVIYFGGKRLYNYLFPVQK